MRSLLVLALLPVLIAACASPEPATSTDSEAAATAPSSDQIAAPPLEDPTELARVAEARQEWVQAFADGNPDPVEFLFQQEAVFLTDEQKNQLGDTASSAASLLETYTAELSLDGGQTINEAQNWIVDWPGYELSLTPKDGGEPIHLEGEVFVRHHRDPETVLELALRPVVGSEAPDFNLNYMSGNGSVELSELREEPVVLVFGSDT